MLQTIPSFYTKNSEKSLFISANTYEKYIVCKNYCIAHYDNKTYFLHVCKFHIILLENVDELLRKSVTFCFSYQHVDCLYTLFKYLFSGILLQRVDKCLITCNEQLTLITKTRDWTECRSLQKRGSCGKSTKSNYSAPAKRQKQRKPVVQSLHKESKKAKRLNLDWS